MWAYQLLPHLQDTNLRNANLWEVLPIPVEIILQYWASLTFVSKFYERGNNMRTNICIPYSISRSASLPLIRYRNTCGRYDSYFPNLRKTSFLTLSALFETSNMHPYPPKGPNFACLEIFAMVSFLSDIYNFIIQKCEVYFRPISPLHKQPRSPLLCSRWQPPPLQL